MGRAEDARSLPAFCNTFLARKYPDPAHDCARTSEELGRPPTPLIEGLGLTIEWLRRHRKL